MYHVHVGVHAATTNIHPTASEQASKEKNKQHHLCFLPLHLSENNHQQWCFVLPSLTSPGKRLLPLFQRYVTYLQSFHI